jgi:hypothetical protein
VGAPGVFGKDVILKGVKVLCFDIVLQVFILLGLEAFPVYKLVTSGYGTPERFRGSISGSFWEHKKKRQSGDWRSQDSFREHSSLQE